jgi:hypothetical protein
VSPIATGIELATAYVELIVDSSQVGPGIRRAFGQADGEVARAGKKSGDRFAAGITSGITGAAKKIAAPLAAAFAGVKIADLFGDIVTAGSTFEQAIGGVEAVFKDEAEGIKRSAEGAADALGLPKNAYLELATVLGASLKNKGIEDFAGQSENLITLGADLAAQFGGPTKDAVDALSAALRGETDPIERYGISLNETAVNAKLAEMGVKRLDGRYTEQQKTVARLALLTEQSKDALGAFGRESDTFAGKQARLSANWENIKTQIGTALLPALTDLSEWFLDKGLPAIQEFGGWVKDELWPALKDGWETVRPALEQFQTIIADAFGDDSSGKVTTFAGFITDTLIPAVSTFATVYLPMLASQFAIVINTVQTAITVMTTIRNAIAAVVSTILGAFIAVTEGFQSMLRALGNVPGFGWAADAAKKMQGPIDKAKELKRSIDNLKDKTVDVTVRYNVPGNGPLGDVPGRRWPRPRWPGHQGPAVHRR